MELWIILMLATKVINNFCPFTSQFLAKVGYVAVIAELIFIVLCFIIGSHWWYGLVSIAIYLIVPILLPKVDPSVIGARLRTTSMIGSVICDILLIGMYLSLLKMI